MRRGKKVEIKIGGKVERMIFGVKERSERMEAVN